MDFLRDVQQVVGENYLNYFLLTMFYREKPYSLAEILFQSMPDDVIGGQALIASLLNTRVLGYFFEELKSLPPQRLDLRCSFSKDYMTKGHLGDAKLSRVWFREGDAIDLDMHLGCGVYLYKQQLRTAVSDESDLDSEEKVHEYSLSSLIDMMGMLTADPADTTKWAPFRSFFMSMEARVQLDLSPGAKMFEPLGIRGINMASQWPFVFGKIVDVTPVIHELKVYEGETERADEAERLNNSIMHIKSLPDSLLGY